MKESNSNELEHYVSNKDAYNKYLAYMEHPLIRKYGKESYKASDGRLVNIRDFPKRIEKIIEGLSEDEKKKIWRVKKAYTKIYNYAMGYKSAAFAYRGRNNMFKSGPGFVSALENRREEIIDLFGRMYTIKEVHQIVVKDWKLPISVQVLTTFAKKHNQLITEKIASYKLSYEDVRLAVKRSRLDELTWLYVQHKEKYKTRLDANDSRILLGILEQIRKEVEGDSIKLEGDIGVKIETTVNTHLQKEAFRELNIQFIVLAKVAAKMHCKVFNIYQSIINSWYRQFAGLVQKPLPNEMVEFPSSMVYDWEEIKGKHQSLLAEEVKFEEALEKHNKEKSEESISLGLKNKLLGLLVESNNDLKEKQSTRDFADIDIQGEKLDDEYNHKKINRNGQRKNC